MQSGSENAICNKSVNPREEVSKELFHSGFINCLAENVSRHVNNIFTPRNLESSKRCKT